MTAAVGIFAPGENKQARMLRDALESIGCEAFLFDTSLPPEEKVLLDGDKARWNGTELMDLDAAYVHGFTHEFPVIPEPSGMRDFSVWQADYPATQQKYSFLYSLFTRMAHCGVRLFNPPAVCRSMFARTHLLNELGRAGFDVPDFISSNDPGLVESFSAKHETLIWRPHNGRAAWQLCLQKQRDALVRPDLPPPLIAEAKNGTPVRCLVCEGKPIAAFKTARPSENVPERLELLTSFDAAPFGNISKQLAEVLGAPWFQVLFVPDGSRAWMYDIDADPVLEWMPETFRTQAIKSLAAGLAGSLCKSSASPPKQAERPSIFLKRMLRVLFDFERIKYGKN